MELLEQLQARLAGLDAAALKRRRRVVSSGCGPVMTVDGKERLAFCSNDYLGLAKHPALAAALAEGAARYGAGSGASHLVNGHQQAHAEVEQRLAGWMSPFIPQSRSLLFSTGYMANMGLLSALAGPDADLFSEQLNHASLIDGARLSGAKVAVYPHKRLDVLAEMLEQSRARSKLVVTDSVFSMDGDLAPLPALLALCERHGAWLVVDDAHGFGVLGDRGRGVLSHFGLHSPYLVYVGTLGKAAGLSGAFVAAHETVIEWLVQRARQYIFTTAMSPALAHALLTSLDLIESEEGEQRRQHLASLIGSARRQLAQPAWRLLDSPTAIQPLVLGTNVAALSLSAALDARGIWVPAIRPPTVPEGTARLRVTLSAAHSMAQLARLCESLAECASAQEEPA